MLGRVDVVHGGYYTLIWAVTRLAGSSEFAVRFPSAVAMAAAAAAVTALGQRLVSVQAGLAAGLVMAVLPGVSWYIAFCIPAAALLAGAALAALGQLAGLAALVAIAVAGLPAQIAQRAPGGHGFNIRRVEQIVAWQARPGDAVLNLSTRTRRQAGGEERGFEAAYPYGLAALHDISQGATPAHTAAPDRHRGKADRPFSLPPGDLPTVSAMSRPMINFPSAEGDAGVQGSVTIWYRGATYQLGRGPQGFGLWSVAGPPAYPLEHWPDTPEGWAAAWSRFTALEPPGSIVHLSSPAAPPASSVRLAGPAIASLLLAAGVVCGVAGLFPPYLSGSSLAREPADLVTHSIYLATWTASALFIQFGGARGRAAAFLGLGTSIVTFGFFLADAGTVIASGAHVLGLGLVLALVGWLACTAGSVLACRPWRLVSAAVPGWLLSPAVSGPGHRAPYLPRVSACCPWGRPPRSPPPGTAIRCARRLASPRP